MLGAMLDAHARRNAMRRCTDGRTDLRRVFGYLPEKKLTLSNARERRKKSQQKKRNTMHDKAFNVKCRYCYAETGQPCINKARDNTPPLKHAPGHPIRLRDSGYYDEDEELF